MRCGFGIYILYLENQNIKIQINFSADNKYTVLHLNQNPELLGPGTGQINLSEFFLDQTLECGRPSGNCRLLSVCISSLKSPVVPPLVLPMRSPLVKRLPYIKISDASSLVVCPVGCHNLFVQTILLCFIYQVDFTELSQAYPDGIQTATHPYSILSVYI